MLLLQPARKAEGVVEDDGVVEALKAPRGKNVVGGGEEAGGKERMCGWMREGGGAGAQQPRAGGRGDSLGGATDSVLQPPYSQSYKNIPKLQLFLFLL